MTPRKTPAASIKTDISSSPFEQITQLEHAQEERVLMELDKFSDESRETEKAILNSEKLQEEMFRDKAQEELKEYARTEPAAILVQAESDTKEMVKAIDKHATKKLAKEAQQLLSDLTSGSLFTQAA